MLYAMYDEVSGHVKCGHTMRDVAVRAAEHGRSRPGVRLRLVGALAGTRDDERRLHQRLRAYRVAGRGREWYHPSRELLSLFNIGVI
jgi:hypothetical protein